MMLQTDEWTTSSEAARLLSISRQRVDQLGDDGALEIARPWPRVTLVRRRSLALRLAGHIQSRILLADVRRYVLTATGADNINDVPIDVIRDRALDMVIDARPLWDAKRRDLWALDVASRLRPDLPTD